MKVCLQLQPEFCSRENLLIFTSRDNRMRNLHKFILEQHGMEALWLFKGWEIFQLRDYDYRNHRIFTLKCISKEIVPVSLRFKTTIRTEKARKIIRKPEKDLLQARFKSIKSVLGDNAKQRELSRSQLASIISTPTMDKCQHFIDKVSELRLLKIKERQINKFSRLLLKKEGNITWFTNRPNPQAGSASEGKLASFVLGGKLGWFDRGVGIGMPNCLYIPF